MTTGFAKRTRDDGPYLLWRHMKERGGYIRAYQEFRDSVDFTTTGFLPNLEKMVWYLLVGVPPVPADADAFEDARMVAIDQRVNILKAVFVELNHKQPEPFLDEGLSIYDEAARLARELIQEEVPDTLGRFLELTHPGSETEEGLALSRKEIPEPASLIL